MNKHIYSVNEINSHISDLFSDDPIMRRLSVGGEISTVNEDKKGHIYFTIKDNVSILSCAMWNSKKQSGLSFPLKTGQSVVITGYIGVYATRGEYRLYADKIELAGSGNLYEEYERLKKKLREEGIFDISHKKEIPPYPNVVGIVTSKTGAVIEDIKRTARELNPFVQLVLYPAKVQGEGADKTIIAGIKRLEEYGVDTIIIGRGGGSMEDLWCFNSEELVRTIYACKIPIISAVGHQTDRTLSDEVADASEATPTAAAVRAVSNLRATLDELRGRRDGLRYTLMNKIDKLGDMVEKLELRLMKESPESKLRQKHLLIKRSEEMLNNQIRNKISEYDKKIINKKNNMMLIMRDTYEKTYKKFLIHMGKIEGNSPLKRLMGGYSYVENEKGENIRSVTMVNYDERLKLILSDGIIKAKVEEIKIEDEYSRK